MVFVSHRISVWLVARAAGGTCFLLRPAKAGGASAAAVVEETGAVKLRRLSLAEARWTADSVHQTLLHIYERWSIHAVGLWNGLHLEGRVATAFARARGLKTIYFELGNIEPKLFIDAEGVNAASRLARCPEILDSFDVIDSEIAEWRSRLKRRAHDAYSVPQAAAVRRLSLWSFLDRMAGLLLRIPQPMPLPAEKAFRKKIASRGLKLAPSIRPADPYLFLPLQISYDTSLVLFSSIDNFEAIERAAKRARECGLKLVVKPHPAERDPSFFVRAASICEQNGYLWTSWNVSDLVQNAEEVFVINSSVGLEAIALEKKLTILGDAFYRSFSERDAAVYALKYLLDFDPFGSKPASNEVTDQIVRLLEAKD